MPSEYAHALYLSLVGLTTKQEVVTVIDSVISILHKYGKIKALPEILRTYQRIIERQQVHTPTLTIANEHTLTRAYKEARTLLGECATEALTTTDQSLIGGWRYTDKTTLVDASYRYALMSLYHSIINKSTTERAI